VRSTISTELGVQASTKVEKSLRTQGDALKFTVQLIQDALAFLYSWSDTLSLDFNLGPHGIFAYVDTRIAADFCKPGADHNWIFRIVLSETDDPTYQPGKIMPLLSEYSIHFLQIRREPNRDHCRNRRMEEPFSPILRNLYPSRPSIHQYQSCTLQQPNLLDTAVRTIPNLIGPSIQSISHIKSTRRIVVYLDIIHGRQI